MERKHLLEKNAEIYCNIGETLNKVANKECNHIEYMFTLF